MQYLRTTSIENEKWVIINAKLLHLQSTSSSNQWAGNSFLNWIIRGPYLEFLNFSGKGQIINPYMSAFSLNDFCSDLDISICRICRLSNVHNSSPRLLNSIFLHLSWSPKWGGGAIFSCITHQLQTHGLFHFSSEKTKPKYRSCR